MGNFQFTNWAPPSRPFYSNFLWLFQASTDFAAFYAFVRVCRLVVQCAQSRDKDIAREIKFFPKKGQKNGYAITARTLLKKKTPN